MFKRKQEPKKPLHVAKHPIYKTEGDRLAADWDNKCTHPNEYRTKVGDYTTVWYCPDCGKNH